MVKLINKKLSVKQRKLLYRILFTINKMDFSYLLPIVCGTTLLCLISYRYMLPKSYIVSLSNTQKGLYYTFVAFFTVCFMFYIRPYVRRIIAKIRAYFYRRKKRATRSLFF